MQIGFVHRGDARKTKCYAHPKRFGFLVPVFSKFWRCFSPIGRSDVLFCFAIIMCIVYIRRRAHGCSTHDAARTASTVSETPDFLRTYVYSSKYVDGRWKCDCFSAGSCCSRNVDRLSIDHDKFYTLKHFGALTNIRYMHLSCEKFAESVSRFCTRLGTLRTTMFILNEK